MWARYLLFIYLHFFVFSAFSFSQAYKDTHYVKIPEFITPPKIDGKLENLIWDKGAVIDTFTQYEPREGAKPSEKTVAYIGYDKKNLYIAVRCFDSNPGAIRARITRRDKFQGDDKITIYLDTFNDKKRAFVFQVNPCGIQTDAIYKETVRDSQGKDVDLIGIDRDWDTFFLSDAYIDEGGYSIELAIPFKSLRFPHTPHQVWGLQILRTIKRKNEQIFWSPVSRAINGFLIQSGNMEIKGVIEKGKNFEVIPVLTALNQSEEKFAPELGVSLKYGVTSDLTADITYNPDFSQVEADVPQIDVNQRYALYYPEKRPFFLEGKDLFETPLELIYTQKIFNPRWGVKLTGKQGKTALGFLSAYDESPTEIDIPSSSSNFDKNQSYRALINVFRLKRDLYPESHIGFIIFNKEMRSSWNTLSDSYNRVGGIDGHFKFRNYYRFSFQIVSSLSKVGSKKTDFVPAMNFNFSRASRHLTLSADWRSIPSDFEAATGFFPRKDIRSLQTRAEYAFLPQNDFIISIRPAFEYRRIYDFSQTLTDEAYEFSLFLSGWRQSYIGTTFSSSLERYSGINFRKQEIQANFSSEPFSWLGIEFSFSFGDGIYYAENPYLGYKTSFWLQISLKPGEKLLLWYDFKNNEFYKKRRGEKVYEVNVLRQRIIYQISRSLSLRLITDYNDHYKKLYSSFLISYEYRPSTVFYIGIDDNQQKDESGIFRIERRYYFIKFSYWWRF
jgi:hypothetical protein